jgi:hypothetical protein
LAQHFAEQEPLPAFGVGSFGCGSRHEETEKPLACIKQTDLKKAPQNGRLIRPRLAGFDG